MVRWASEARFSAPTSSHPGAHRTVNGRLTRLLAGIAAIAALGEVGLVGGAFAQTGASIAGAAGNPVTNRELVEIRSPSGLTLSPDGAYAVIRIDWQDVATNATHLRWRLIRLRDGAALDLADGGTPRWNVNGFLDTETPQFSPDGKWIYFRAVHGQAAQIWRVARAGGHPQQLTRDAADVYAFAVMPDGALHYATAGARRSEIIAAEDAEIDDGVLLDRTVIQGIPVAGGFPVNGRMATFRQALPRSMNFGRSTLLGDRPLRVMTVQPRTRMTQPSTPEEAARLSELWTGSYGGAAPFEPFADNRLRSRQGVVASLKPVAAENGAIKPRSGRQLVWQGEGHERGVCSVGLCTDADELDIVGWTRDERLVFQTRTFGLVGLHVWDVASDRVTTLVSEDGVLGNHDSGQVGRCQLAEAEAVCISASAAAPPKLVAIDLRSGSSRIVHDPNPNLPPDRLGLTEKITLTDRFGNTTFAYVVLPHTRHKAMRLPLVISSYTCSGFLLGGSGRDVPEHVLAGAGYAAACLEMGIGVRRLPDFVGTLANRNATSQDFFEGVARELDKREVIDLQRVGIAGFSGSSTALTRVLTKSTLFAAAVITTESNVDVIACYLVAHTDICRNATKTEAPDQAYDSRTGYFSESPAWNSDRIRTPLLMQLPESEYMTMLQLHAALRDLGRAVEARIFPNAYHYKHRPRQRLSVYERNVAWMQFWLEGRESGEAAQLTRWRELRDRQCEHFAGANALPDPPWYCRA